MILYVNDGIRVWHDEFDEPGIISIEVYIDGCKNNKPTPIAKHTKELDVILDSCTYCYVYFFLRNKEQVASFHNKNGIFKTSPEFGNAKSVGIEVWLNNRQ